MLFLQSRSEALATSAFRLAERGMVTEKDALEQSQDRRFPRLLYRTSSCAEILGGLFDACKGRSYRPDMRDWRDRKAWAYSLGCIPSQSLDVSNGNGMVTGNSVPCRYSESITGVNSTSY
jgi:hypothetical protein